MYLYRYFYGEGDCLDTELVLEAISSGEENLVTFRNLFLPADDDVKSPWFHYEWSDILLNGDTHYAIEGFRESAKTSIVLRAFPLYCLMYPARGREYIVFIMANQKGASKRLKEISDEYLSNELMNLNLVEVKEQSEKAFECLVTGFDGKEHRIRFEAYGKGSSVRGLSNRDRRPDIVLIDDPQDMADSLSDTVQDNDYDWFLSDVLFLGKKTRIFFIGNNLGEKCLIERVISNKEELRFQAIRIPIMDEFGKSNWEERFPVSEILAEKEQFRKIGKLDIWEREKMCIAISPENQLFKKSYFRYYDREDLDISNWSTYITCDLAISEKESADFTSICVLGVNEENMWFVLDIVYGRFDPSETIDNIFDLVVRYRPVCVGIEKVAYQAALRHFVEKEMPKRNVWFMIRDLEAKTKKEIRISALQPRFKAGAIWFPQGEEFLLELESELLAFPRGLHDDLVDSLAYMAEVALPPVGSYWKVKTEDIPYGGAL